MNKQELIDFESKIAKLIDSGKITHPVHLSGGNEEQLIEIFKGIKKGDWKFSTHRAHYHYLLSGGSSERLEREIREGRSMYLFDKEINFYSSAIVAGCHGPAVGVAEGLKRMRSNKHVWCFVGDGAEDSGHFYEAVRYVDGHNLPCSFIIEDNNLSVGTPKIERYGESEITWPDCVIRYRYQRVYGHYGTGKQQPVGGREAGF